MSNATTVEREDLSGLQTYTIDPAHSQVMFKVRHLGFSKVTGRFDTFNATLHFDPRSLGTLDVAATLEAASVNTGDAQRDAHLRSGDFLETETYPHITFKSNGWQAVQVDSLELKGELTIRGVTEPVVLAVTYLGEARDPWGGERVAFEAKTRINRRNFGLTWNNVLETGGLLVGEEVEIYLEIQAVRSKD